MAAKFYCDESGNTGTHWADADQPIFVHGGWLVPDSSALSVEAQVVELRGTHRLNAPELKWKQIERRSPAVYRDFFRMMLDNGCMPFFWVMDKDFITSAKVIETFFDPAYNKAFHPALAGAGDVKKEFAEILMGSDEVPGQFAALLRGCDRPSSEVVRDLAATFARHLEAGNAPILAETLHHFSDEAIADIQDELGAEAWMRTTFGHSLPALVQLLANFLQTRPVQLEIVHDNLVRMEMPFDMVRAMFRQPTAQDWTAVGDRVYFHTLPMATGLRLADSKVEPMVQMADLLCGFVRTVFERVKHGEGLEPDELATCLDLAMIRDEFSTWDANMPTWMWAGFARLAFGGV